MTTFISHDNRILEYDVEGKAALIVTGDKEMLPVKDYKVIRLITLTVEELY